MTPASISLRTAAAAACLLPVLLAQAAPVVISAPYMNYERRNINSLGFTSGDFFRIGANSVVPNGTTGGTTGTGTTTNLATGAAVSRTIFPVFGPAIPNFFQRLLPIDPALLGPWTLTFRNGADSASAVVSLPSTATVLPYVNSITLSGSSLNPTFSWTPPSSGVVNGYRLNIIDKTLVSATSSGNVASLNVGPAVTAHTVTAADFTLPGYAFTTGKPYVIEISAIQTKDGLSTNLNNDNLASISRTYADFTPREGGGPLVNLPVVRAADGAYVFDIAVVPDVVYYIDPLVAVGYDYAVGAGDPLFRSVVLPTDIGDGVYDILGDDGAGGFALLADDIAGGVSFDFGAAGVGRFRVTGIEPSAGLDPANTTAFVTGLTFTGAGRFTGTQTPLTLDTGTVPEPASWLLVLLALGAGSAATRRPRRGVSLR